MDEERRADAHASNLERHRRRVLEPKPRPGPIEGGDGPSAQAGKRC
jgi:hypothetical protein